MPQKTPANSSRRATPEQSIDTWKEECERLRQRNERLQDKLANSEDKVSKYEDKISKFEDKLDAANRDLRHAKDEIKRLQNDNGNASGARDTLEKAFKQLRYEKEMLKHENTKLKASYENLRTKYEAIPEDRRNPMAAPIPERPKRPASSATSGGSGTSSRVQEAERGRRLQADKERLGARFETNKRPPTSGGNRNSFIEGFGPRRRSGSAAPSSRVMYDDVARTGRREEPMFSTREAVTYSAVPRSIPSSGGYRSSGSSALDDDYEDGDYHLRPI